jgi:hypothetical protein
MNKQSLLITLIVLISNISLAQENKPKSYVGEDGKLYWNKAVPAFFWIGSTPDKPEHKLESEATPKYANPHYFDTEGINFIRSKDAFDPITQKIIEPRIEVLYEIYADGIAPLSKISFNQSQIYKANGKVYYGPGLKIDLESSDGVSGVEKIYYSLNSGSYINYSVSVDITKEGDQNFKYYASDNVGNSEQARTEEFILDITAPKSNLNVNGLLDDNVIASNSRIYLLMEDNLSGIKETYYSFDGGKFMKYDNKDVLFQSLSEDKHLLTYYSVDNVGNREADKTFEFFFDKTGPLMAADVLGDRFIVGDQIYFSGRTKLKLTAVDNKVGVKEIKYSIDDSEFTTYDQPFYLPSVSGIHSIKYYSVDNMNNKSAGKGGYEEFKHSVSKVYVDLVGPTISHNIIGKNLVRNDTLLIGPYSSLQIKATDEESGLQRINYSINDDPGEALYENPVTFNKSGIYTVQYYAFDNVNNRNIDKVTFREDTAPPTMFFQSTIGRIGTKDGVDIFPASSGIFIVGTDTEAGLSQIFYKIDGEAEKPYTTLISGLKKGDKHTISARAVDNLGNTFTQEFTFIFQ